jgi:hypothetical protein
MFCAGALADADRHCVVRMGGRRTRVRSCQSSSSLLSRAVENGTRAAPVEGDGADGLAS